MDAGISKKRVRGGGTLNTVVITVLVLVVVAAGAYYAYARYFGVRRAVTSFISANSPVAELATRKIVWRVMVAEESLMRTSVEETVLTIKAGYDLALVKQDDITYDLPGRKAAIRLPAPKIMSIDTFMTSTPLIKKETIASRLFSRERPTELDVLARLVVDSERYGLLSADSIREGMEKYAGGFVREQYDFEVEFSADAPPPPADMVLAYLEEKGVEIDRAAFLRLVENVRKGKPQ